MTKDVTNHFALLKRIDLQNLKDLEDRELPPVRHVGMSPALGASFNVSAPVSSDKWDARFYEMAKLVATWSKDPQVQVGAVAVSPNQRQFSVGYNGLPAGIADTAERLEGEDRVPLTVHAELNAILNSGHDLAGWTLYVTRPPCLECAKAIIQSRITHVVRGALPDGSSWAESCDTGFALMREAGVKITTRTPCAS